MLTLPDDIKLKDLRQEFEAAQAMAEEFPKRIDFQKLADSLELAIHNIEVDRRYI
jgi:hypothetical protein